jgi:hypothetical protein
MLDPFDHHGSPHVRYPLPDWAPPRRGRPRSVLLLASRISPAPMPPRRKGEKRARHGTRSLILKVFQASDAPATLRTTAIVERVSKEAGTSIPAFSVYSALRTLVKRKVLKAGREGHEKSYSLVGPTAPTHAPTAAPTPAAWSAPRPVGTPVAATPVAPTTSAPTPISAPPPALPHKLAVGEALILEVGENHVESVTNVHGHLVVERHPRKQ